MWLNKYSSEHFLLQTCKGAAQKWAIVRLTFFFETAGGGGHAATRAGWRSPWIRHVQKVISFVIDFKIIFYNFVNIVCYYIIACFSAAPICARFKNIILLRTK
jgi:hypothetical protein